MSLRQGHTLHVETTASTAVNGGFSHAEADIFQSVLDLESNLVAEGYDEGYREGLIAGKEEGREVGLKTGFETGEEVGFYSGCIQVWSGVLRDNADAFSARARRSIGQLEEQLRVFPLLEPEREDFQELLSSLRTKFRAITATLGVHLLYSDIPPIGADSSDF